MDGKYELNIKGGYGNEENVRNYIVGIVYN